jgi:hypothetical protein
MKLSKNFKIIFILLLLHSCVTHGRYFPSDMTWIKLNKTNMKDVKIVLGEPDMIGVDNFYLTWTYHYYNKIIFKPHMIKKLKIYWNKDGSIKYFKFSSNFKKDIKRLVNK